MLSRYCSRPYVQYQPNPEILQSLCSFRIIMSLVRDTTMYENAIFITMTVLIPVMRVKRMPNLMLLRWLRYSNLIGKLYDKEYEDKAV